MSRSASLFTVISTSHDQVDPDQWESFLERCPDATYFHTPEWMSLLAGSFPRWKGRVLISVDDHGEWVALLPWMETLRFGLRTNLSMPFGTFGGPVVASGCPLEAGAELCRCLRPLSWNTRGLLLTEFENRCLAWLGARDGRTVPGHAGLYNVTEGTTHVLDLSGGAQAVWAERFAPQRRRQTTCARRRGLRVRRAGSPADWLAYASIYQEVARHWHTRCRVPSGFFDRLSDNSPSRAHLWVAEHEGEIVAGNLSFFYRDQAISWSGTMRKEHASLHPAVALHHATIEEACAAGCRLYHLGPSPGLMGAARFKEQFGCETRPYRVWTALSPGGRMLERIRPSLTRSCRTV